MKRLNSCFAVSLTVCALAVNVGAVRAASVDKAVSIDVRVTNAWIRSSVKGQMATGGFMTLTSVKQVKLLGFASPAAKSSQLHEMTMAGDVMQMRELASLVLPAGQAVSLQPGGLHLMLIGLKKVLKPGDKVPLRLKFQATDGRIYWQSVNVAVAAKQP